MSKTGLDQGDIMHSRTAGQDSSQARKVPDSPRKGLGSTRLLGFAGDFFLSSPLVRYSFALAALAVAFLWRVVMVRQLNADLPPYITFYPAVMAVSLVAGFGPGLLVTAGSLLVCIYLILPPIGQYAVAGWAPVVGLTLFAIMGVFMAWMAEAYRKARHRILGYAEQLESYVNERPADLHTHVASGSGAPSAKGRLRVDIEARGSVIVALLIALIVSTTIGVLSWRTIRDADRAAELVTHTLEVRQHAAQAISAISDTESLRRAYILSSDPELLRRFSDSRAQIASVFAELRGMTADNPVQQRRLDELDALLKPRLGSLDKFVREWSSGIRDMEAQRIYTLQYVALGDQIRDKLLQFDAEELQLLSKRSARAKAEENYATQIVVAGTGAVWLLLLLAFLMLNREFHRRRQLENELAQHRDSLQEEVKRQTASVYNANARLRHFADANIVGIVIATASGKIVEANDYYLRTIGFTRDEFEKGLVDWRAITPPEWLAVDEKAIAELRERGVCTPYEKEYVRRDGTRVPIFISDALLPGEEEQIAAFVVDITARKRAEESRRESEEKLRLILDSTAEAICGLDLDGKVTFSNPACLRILGFSSTESLLGTSVHDVIHHSQQNGKPLPADECPVLRGVRKGERTHLLEEIFWRRDGHSFPAECWSFPMVHDGKLVGAVLTFQDITERKRSESALVESEAQFRTMVNAIPQLAWMANPDGWIFWYNQGWYDYTGTTPQQMEGWGWQSVHDPAELPKVMERWQASVATGEPFDMIFPLRSAQGEFRSFLTRVRPMKDATGKVLRWFGTNTDIENQKRIESALQESLDRLEKVLAVETVGVMFWDLNTGCMVDANNAFLKMMGYSRSDVESRSLNWQTLTPPEYMDISRAEVEKFMVTGRVGPYEKEYFCKDGTRKWLLFAGSSLGNNQCVEFCVDISDRKRTESALQETEANYRKLVESASDGIFIADADGRILDVNALGCRLLGYSREEVLTFNLSDIVVSRETERLAPELKRLRAGDIVLSEWLYRRKDGTIFPGEVSGTVLPDGRNLGIMRDITERKQAEVALRESEAKFRTLANLVPQMVWMCKPDGLNVYFNQRWVDYTGMTLEESYGRGWNTPFHDDDKQKAWDAWNHAVATGEPYIVESRLRAADGSYRWFLMRGVPMRDASGDIVKWFGTCTDVEEFKQAEEAVRLGRERLSLAFKIGQAGTFDWDIVNNVNTWSPEIEELYGVEPGHFAGTYEAWERLVHPEDLPMAAAAIRESLATGEFISEWRIKRAKDGEVRWVAARGKVVFDGHGKPTRMIGINLDITDRKLDEQKIRQLNDELERRVVERTAQLETANKELEAFTYSVSHDLRAPLRHITGFARMLVEECGAELSPEAKHYVDVVCNGTRQMGALVDDLLNLGRVGRQTLNVQITGLNGLVEEVVRELKAANPARDIEWKIQTLPFVECDPALIKQVFANLLSNAVKYSRPRQHAVIEVGTAEGNIFVRDNGVGFSMKYADKLFGIFQRLHRAEDFEGTGVGLATVQRILHKHGGRIWATAELDKGATFFFQLAQDSENAETKAAKEVAIG